MRTTIIGNRIKDDHRFIVITDDQKPSDDRVVDWTTAVRSYRVILNQLSNHPPPSSDPLVDIPYILRVTHYSPPLPKPVPQLKGTVKSLRSKVDPFYQSAKKLLSRKDQGKLDQTLRGVRLSDTPKQPTPPVKGISCVACDLEITSYITTINARVSTGLIKREVEIVDPDTGTPTTTVKYVPTFKVGRLCGVCRDTLKGVSTPPREGEFEYLPERYGIGSHRKRTVVTAGSMKAFDIAKRKEDTAPKYVDLGGILIKDVPDLEEVDPQSYQKYGMTKKGGVKNQSRTGYLVDFNERNR